MEETPYFDREITESDEEIEKVFLLDFIEFGIHHRSTTARALLELSKRSNNPLEKRILLISAFSAFYALIEDFSAIIYAIHMRREEGKPILQTLSTYQVKDVDLFKALENKTTNEVIEYLGLDRYEEIDLNKYGISHQRIEETVNIFLENLLRTITWQKHYKKAFNWIKHGNTVVSRASLFSGYDDEAPGIIRHDEKSKSYIMTLFPHSETQLENFAINTNHISEAMHELILLYLFNQYPGIASERLRKNK